MQKTAQPRPAAEIGRRLVGPSGIARTAVTAGPARAPAVPPAAMKPNRRLAWALLKISAMKLQKTETMNRLKTLVQMKKARATQTWVSPDRNRTKKISRLTMKKK